MKLSDVQTFLKQNETQIRGFGINSLAVFGSVARNEATSTSDIDILVEFSGKVTFDRYMNFKFYLEDNLGRKVDLVDLKMLKPQIRQTILNEAIHVA
ncbi:MAG: nucleotidyltransferase family protein [Spirulina sp. SIO3F2]|nr:nucleotidyltransferase family protein [Spirulina sp. SIO3F2]